MRSDVSWEKDLIDLPNRRSRAMFVYRNAVDGIRMLRPDLNQETLFPSSVVSPFSPRSWNDALQAASHSIDSRKAVTAEIL